MGNVGSATKGDTKQEMRGEIEKFVSGVKAGTHSTRDFIQYLEPMPKGTLKDVLAELHNVLSAQTHVSRDTLAIIAEGMKGVAGSLEQPLGSDERRCVLETIERLVKAAIQESAAHRNETGKTARFLRWIGKVIITAAVAVLAMKCVGCGPGEKS
jgi:hypothetical protein